MALGIIAAMSIEIDYLLKNCVISKEIEFKGKTFYYGTIGKTAFILVICGIGKVNSAVYTQILIDHFEIEQVIHIGIAGALSEKLEPLDIVIGKDYCHHDVRPQQMENQFPYCSSFPADTSLLRLFTAKLPDAYLGTIVSGENFIDTHSEKERIRQLYSSLAVDMETSAIAHACYINNMPFLALRDISDFADESSTNDYEDNEQHAAQKVCQALIHVFG